MLVKDNEPQQFVIDTFKSGLITRLPAERIPVDAFSDGENIDLNQSFFPQVSLGQYKYNQTPMATSPTRGGCIYKTVSGTKYYVFACAGRLWYSIANSGIFQKYQGPGAEDLSFDPDVDVEFAQYNGKLYMTNGLYPTITNTGYETTRLIKIEGTTPTALTVSDIPKGLKYIWTIQERIFGLNSSEQANGLFWTNAYFDYTTNNETNWTPVAGLNYDYVGKDDGEVGCAIYPYNSYVFVFKNKNVYKYAIQGDITSWGSVRVDTSYGCPFNRTICELEGYLYWLSESGVVKSDGTNCNLIDEAIRDRILALPQLKSGSLNWIQSLKTDFDLGTFGVDLIDTSFDDLKQNSQSSEFAGGTFGAKIIQGTADSSPNIRILPQSVAADWNAGTFVNTQILGNTIILNTESYQYYAWGSYTAYANTSGTLIGTAYIYDPSTGTYVRAVWTFDLGSALVVDSITGVSGVSAQYSDDNSTWITGISGTHRYWRFIQSPGPSGSGNNPIFNYHYTAWGYIVPTNTTRYLTSGSFVTQTLDYGFTPKSLGILSSIFTAGNGTTLTFKTRTSDNGSGWDDWVATTPGNIINSTVRRYIQIQANFTSPTVSSGETSYTPSLQKIIISAPFISKSLDYGFTPISFGNFSLLVTTPGTSSITYYTRSSADGSNWEEWTAIAAGGAIASTLNKYLQWYALLNPSIDGTQTPQINSVYVVGQWRSLIKDLGFVPTAFGKFTVDDTPAGQTITYWMRSAATSAEVDSASWYQQTPGSLVSNIPLNQYIQVEVRFNTDNATQIPSMQDFSITYYQFADLVKPCSYAILNQYCLNIAKPGSSINDTLWKYNITGNGFWQTPRTNKYNNVYFIDQMEIISGTSQSDGFVRLNETGTNDDGIPIVAWFLTKKIQLGNTNNIIRRYMVFSRSNSAWGLSFDLNSQGFTALDISPSSVPSQKVKSLAGLNIGNIIQFKCLTDIEDNLWQIQAIGIEFEIGRQVRSDLGAGDSWQSPMAGNALWEWASDGGIQPRSR
jgi:hypothetical protein